jgi:F420-dependent oxidoreductase-like protein
MRIGLSGGAATVDRMIEQAVEAEDDGFASLWYASAIGGDPLVAMALAGRATTTIELGTSVLQTYTCHPVLQANRVVSVVAAMGRPGFTLGIGPSHKPLIDGVYGLSYDHPGRHTEEYVRVLAALLGGKDASFDGEDFRVHSMGRAAAPEHPVPLLVAALGPRLLRVARDLADGTITWMANARAIESHVAPRLGETSRIVAGLPVCVHDDVDAARAEAAQQFAMYGTLPNYQRILSIGGADGPADAAIIGDEASVSAQIEALFAGGATDVWAAIFPAGTDKRGSRERTRALLKELAHQS